MYCGGVLLNLSFQPHVQWNNIDRVKLVMVGGFTPWKLANLTGGSVVKNLPAMLETRVQSWVWKIPWRRKWQPTIVFLPRKSHGQRKLVGCSPWGFKRVRHNWATKQQQQQQIKVWFRFCFVNCPRGPQTFSTKARWDMF